MNEAPYWHNVKYMSIGCTHINSSAIIHVMNMIMLELPYPPSVNHYWGQKGNQRFIGKKGKEFRVAVQLECLIKGIKSLPGRLSVSIDLYPPDNRKRDLDNVLKSLLDAMEHAGCYENDSQIDKLSIVRMEVVKDGKCFVSIIQQTFGEL